MKRSHKIAAVSLASGFLAVAIAMGVPQKTNHIGPAYLYPDQRLTSGQAETLQIADLKQSYCHFNEKEICETYSQSHRDVSDSVHKKVYDEYFVPQEKRNPQNGEIDHFYPLCGGGSNDIKNLWYQPIHNVWNGYDYGYKAKDKLEDFVCRGIKAGTIDPVVAYKKITSDWVAYFIELNLGQIVSGVHDDPVE